MRKGRALGLGGLAGALLLVASGAHAGEPDRGGDRGAPGQEEGPARPPLPPEPETTRLPWGRTVEIGGDVAMIARPTAADAAVRYRPVVGYGVHARWEVFRFLRFSAYFVDADHDLQLFPGALGVTGEIVADPVETIAFGARFAPTLPLSDRARAWASVGVGYGRFTFGRMDVIEPGRPAFTVRERGMSFLELPIGMGVSFDLIRNWLAIELETSGAFVLGQQGEAVESVQAIDAAGQRRMIGPLPRVGGSFVQTLGLSLVL